MSSVLPKIVICITEREPKSLVYYNNSIVTSIPIEQHKDHLAEAFRRLWEANLRVNPEEYTFLRELLKILVASNKPWNPHRLVSSRQGRKTFS
ncbi:unnamed protein product [Ceratitis capitata]|uniref:(Mediterranean fruit fly) hypothetical protein n=1 Tax=Ceratitis capitata TaxID=7213 RepID=A0A811UUY1_CERCA|nr:unnamed protein product [Ceratitis capitata]